VCNLRVAYVKKLIIQSSLGLTDLRQWTADVLDAMIFLENHAIVNIGLSSKNVLLDKRNRIKLFNYAMSYLTDNGADLDFPIM
jgi:hypothetical protein